MLSIDTIARVDVNVTRTSASSVVFDTGLILTPCTSFTESKRLMTFTSSATAVAALQNAGFEKYRNSNGRFIRGLRLHVEDFLDGREAD